MVESANQVFTALDGELAAQRSPAARLAVLAAYVRRCQLCDLHERRRMAVPGEGPSRAAMLIIGEGPGRNEDEAGRPFVGPAGRLLDSFLDQADLRRPDIFITNIVKCRSADLVGGELHNRRPLAWEIKACHPYMDRQIAIVRPRVILCLGNSAAQGMTGGHFSMKQQRGEFFPGPSGSRVLATYHPSFIGRWETPASHDLQRLVVEDMIKAREALA